MRVVVSGAGFEFCRCNTLLNTVFKRVCTLIRIGEMSESDKVLVGKPKGRDCFVVLLVYGRQISFHIELYAFVIKEQFKNISKLVYLACFLFVCVFCQHVSLFCCCLH
jgi:hypothetical protein